MSNMPLVPPILPLPDDDLNKPEPGSEAAEREKAERAERLAEGEVLDPEDLAGEDVADTVKREIEAAERRQKGEPDPESE
ncbi:hypothetical protein K32_24260 [Kaistia sp. 32K]|uniref:hypothetical protein n=1 Tax=Kaistia sp. 32K TaxID=2795690 RepID=UPI001915F584|nr:hypothetical protein [Kaistia sp. 32K]BCP53809.1 hypothetical protein K32_24260 [Kaistia sp. 32K]